MRAAYNHAPQYWRMSLEPKTYEECYGFSPLAHNDDRDEMEVALSAALPVLAESPELVERCATWFAEFAGSGVVGEVHEAYARLLLTDLFAAAPTDTTEENTDG